MAQDTTTKLRPLRDRVLVKRLEEQDDEHGDIIIPTPPRKKPQEGRPNSASRSKAAHGHARTSPQPPRTSQCRCEEEN